MDEYRKKAANVFRDCPYCKEIVNMQEGICRKCGFEFSQEEILRASREEGRNYRRMLVSTVIALLAFLVLAQVLIRYFNYGQ